MTRRIIGTLVVAASLGALGAGAQSRESTAVPRTAADHHDRGVEFHLQRRLDEASREYARALTLDPAREPTGRELALIRRLAPRVHVTPTETFPLKDAAAVLHPGERLIAYHLFWEDDIDFPDDNDPSDHEVVWVQYSADGLGVERFWTYFHGGILNAGDAGIRDARANSMRPRVNVQWGKHGSMPVEWERMTFTAHGADLERKYYPVGQPMTLADYNRGTHQKLKTEGRRLLDHPLARRLGWPARFDGTWEQFADFSRPVNILELLDERKMVRVSRWNSAVINQHFLAYNFRPKTEWPDASGSGARTAGAARTVEASLDEFALPPKSVFDPSMPRYPNAWFYIDAALADSYDAAVKLVTVEIRNAMLLQEVPGPFANPEGCDADVRLEHLQPWEPVEHRSLQHSHAFHMRYYYSALARQKLERVKLQTRLGHREFYRIAASAHYEVEHTNPNHADVEICPVCGRTGAYQDLTGNLVELVHDPLGLELLLDGTIRGEVVRFEDNGQREVGGITSLGQRFKIEPRVIAANSADRNTLRIGIVAISPLH